MNKEWYQPQGSRNDVRVQEKVVAGIQRHGGKRRDNLQVRSMDDSWMKIQWIECSSSNGVLFVPHHLTCRQQVVCHALTRNSWNGPQFPGPHHIPPLLHSHWILHHPHQLPFIHPYSIISFDATPFVLVSLFWILKSNVTISQGWRLHQLKDWDIRSTHIHHPASADVTMNYWNAMCCSTETRTDFLEETKGWNTSDICGTGQHFNERMKATAPFSLKHNASNHNIKSYFCQGDMFYNCKAFAAKNCSQNIKYFQWWRSSNEKPLPQIWAVCTSAKSWLWFRHRDGTKLHQLLQFIDPLMKAVE